jgi:hypothetical protein
LLYKVFSAAPMLARSGSQLITLLAIRRPRWRSPILTVPLRKLGTSASPLEELPTTPSTNATVDR